MFASKLNKLTRAICVNENAFATGAVHALTLSISSPLPFAKPLEPVNSNHLVKTRM